MGIQLLLSYFKKSCQLV